MHHSHARPSFGFAKVIVVLVLAALVGVALYLMVQEQGAREYCEGISSKLEAAIDEGLTPEQVHERIGAEPTKMRNLGKYKNVEEYSAQGPMNSYTVYVYYRKAATQFMEAVSANQTLPDWEKAD